MKTPENFQRCIKDTAKKFLEKTKDKEIFLVSHFDTDGITSAAIMIQALKRLDKKFTLKILKSLEEDFICQLPKNKIIIFMDLASGSLDHMKDLDLENIFILDHHEIVQEIPKEINLINSWLHKENICSAGITYLFCKELNPENRDLTKLAVIGMIGDFMEDNMEILGNDLFKEGEIKRRKGLLIYPSTRPLNRVLEYNSQPYIPGVTGDAQGVIEILRESDISPIDKKYPSIIELDEEKMKRLTTSIMLRNPKTKNRKMIGDIFLINFFNRIEDARELSAMINACSRLGRSDLALRFCLEISSVRKDIESIHAKYKQHIISGIEFLSKEEKIEGNGFVLINARNNILDTIIGTLASIISNSSNYEEGTIIIAMAYREDKIKVSARICGREGKGRNVREVLTRVMEKIDGEIGGHEFAAGCMLNQKDEEVFVETLKKHLEIEMIKV